MHVGHELEKVPLPAWQRHERIVTVQDRFTGGPEVQARVPRGEPG
jgi:hypothetical protein